MDELPLSGDQPCAGAVEIKRQPRGLVPRRLTSNGRILAATESVVVGIFDDSQRDGGRPMDALGSRGISAAPFLRCGFRSGRVSQVNPVAVGNAAGARLRPARMVP